MAGIVHNLRNAMRKDTHDCPKCRGTLIYDSQDNDLNCLQCGCRLKVSNDMIIQRPKGNPGALSFREIQLIKKLVQDISLERMAKRTGHSINTLRPIYKGVRNAQT